MREWHIDLPAEFHLCILEDPFSFIDHKLTSLARMRSSFANALQHKVCLTFHTTHMGVCGRVGESAEGHIPHSVQNCFPLHLGFPVMTGNTRNPPHSEWMLLSKPTLLQLLGSHRGLGGTPVINPLGQRTWESYEGALILCDSLQTSPVSKGQISQGSFGQPSVVHKRPHYCKYKLASSLIHFIFIVLTMSGTILDIFTYYLISIYYLHQPSIVRYYIDLITL